MDPSQHPDRLAVVTGASSGIGKELARLLVTGGWRVLLVADDDAVHEVSHELTIGGGAADAVQCDLAAPEGVEAVGRVVAGRPEPLDVVVLNAGTGAWGRVDEVDLADDLRVVDLDVRSTVHLAKLLVPVLLDRGRGRVLVVSSIAAETPAPLHATYAASKAFVHSYARALRRELAPHGVSVTSTRPGPTRTAFFDRARMRGTRIAEGRQDSPARVARDSFEAMMSGRGQVVPGSRRYAVQAAAARALPDGIAAAVATRQFRPVGRTWRAGHGGRG